MDPMKAQSVLRRFSKWIFVAYLQGTGIALGCAGLLTVATMSWTNFVLDSDFKWLLLAPAVAWLLGLVSYGLAGGRSMQS